MAGDESRSAVRIRIRWTTQGLFLEYSGLPGQLIEAGAATPEMVEPGRRGFRRFDADGELYNVTRRYDTGHVVLSRWKSPAQAAALPGVRDWLASSEGIDSAARACISRAAR
jgi:hypothetical protein